jgi:hypothetical protein
MLVPPSDSWPAKTRGGLLESSCRSTPELLQLWDLDTTWDIDAGDINGSDDL